jgi:hypothetical protein
VAALREVAGLLVVEAIHLPDSRHDEYWVQVRVDAGHPKGPTMCWWYPSAVSDPDLARAIARAIAPGAQDVEGRDIVHVAQSIREDVRECAVRAFRRRAEELERERVEAEGAKTEDAD